MTHKEFDVKEFIAVRKAEGLRIDPSTAEIFSEYALTLDPYGIYDLPEEYHQHQIERTYFARAPASDIWVEFGDLPENTRNAFWEAQRLGLLKSTTTYRGD
jgi:hypothetical protein